MQVPLSQRVVVTPSPYLLYFVVVGANDWKKYRERRQKDLPVSKSIGTCQKERPWLEDAAWLGFRSLVPLSFRNLKLETKTRTRTFRSAESALPPDWSGIIFQSGRQFFFAAFWLSLLG